MSLTPIIELDDYRQAAEAAPNPDWLDLGCGQFPQPGYTGVDSRRAVNPDVVWDLEVHPWPWLSHTVERVFTSHLVEHIVDLIGFMDELHRVCKQGAEVKIVHPYQHSDRAWQDPTHVRALNRMSWAYYSAEWRKAQGLDHYPIRADFEVVKIEAVLAPEWRGQESNPQLQHAIRYGVNVVDDLHVTLVALGEPAAPLPEV